MESHEHYLSEARYLAARSLDPTTKVGAILVRRSSGAVEAGAWNAFPHGVEPTTERLMNRQLKNDIVVHAEVLAIFQLIGRGFFPSEFILYCTHMPCSRCAGIIAEARVREVVAPAPTGEFLERWGASVELTRMIFRDTGVKLVEIAGG